MRSETVTETELAVLQTLWARGELTSGEVAQALYHEVNDPKRASAQKLLERLVWKQCVSADKTTRPHRFRAALTRDEFAGHQIQAIANKLYGGSLCPVLTSLIQSKGVSPRDLAELRKLIDDLSRPARRKSKASDRKASTRKASIRKA